MIARPSSLAATRIRVDDADALEIEVPGRLPVSAPRVARAAARPSSAPSPTRRSRRSSTSATKSAAAPTRCFRAACSSAQPAWEHRQAIERTRALLADPSVPALFEAAFEHDGVRIRADVLERLPGGRFGLREVKASGSVKPEHLDDCAVQQHVLEGCGLRIDSVELVHVNTGVRARRGRDRLGPPSSRAPISRARWPPCSRTCASAWLASTPWCASRARRRSSRRSTASSPTTASSGITARGRSPTTGSSICRGSASASRRCAPRASSGSWTSRTSTRCPRCTSASARRFGADGRRSSPGSRPPFARRARPPTTSTSRRRTRRFRSTPARGRTR